VSTKREHAEKIHGFYAHKTEVPTLGGLLIILAIGGAMLLWGEMGNRWVLLALGTLFGFGAIGLSDDLLKIRKKNSGGLRFLPKISVQVLLSLGILSLFYRNFQFDGGISIPFLDESRLELGWFYWPFAISVIVGSSNALNITDGLDGLAIGCTLPVAVTFAIFSYVSGHALFADYLGVPFFRPAGELTVFCSAIVGAAAAFLWYNCYPASFFMGDTGSLALGSALAAVALFIRQELVLVIVGGIFVWEALSVILQVVSYKTRRKRIFLMSPFHHHLQLRGWPESQITVRFWIFGSILALIGLASLRVH
jgi:phospho-N-acetylmuramoyl-pentapeptide-transferase